jgi:hypothetical protein
MDEIAELFPDIFDGVHEFKFERHMHSELTFDFVPFDYKLKPPLERYELTLDRVWIQKNIGMNGACNVFVPFEGFAFEFSIGFPEGQPHVYFEDDEECSECGSCNQIEHKYVFKAYCFLSLGVRYFCIDEGNGDIVDPQHNLNVAEFAQMIRSILTKNEKLLNCYNFISE